MSVIEFKKLTKDYGENRGVFDLELTVAQGDVFGFVGTNGAGKTTSIRHLMGFIKPQSGSVTINGFDCWHDSAKIKKQVAYIPGEIAFPDALTGLEFLKTQAALLGIKDFSRASHVIERMQLDPTANLKRMSEGMKQKTAIVAAFLADADLLILDEPTTGLDPLMRREFIKMILEEKKNGKTIFMSSHMFEEVEDTCNKVAMIKDGRLIAIKATDDIKHNANKEFKIEFMSFEDYTHFMESSFPIVMNKPENLQVIIKIHDGDINRLMQILSKYSIKFITEIKYTLDKYFKSLY